MALSLKVSSEKALEDATRVKAITFLGRITRLKKKAIVRFKLYSGYGVSSQSPSVPMPSDSRKVLGVEGHSDIKRKIKKMPDK